MHVVLARLLPADKAGQLFLAISFVGLMATLARFGADALIVRDAATQAPRMLPNLVAAVRDRFFYLSTPVAIIISFAFVVANITHLPGIPRLDDDLLSGIPWAVWATAAAWTFAAILKGIGWAGQAAWVENGLGACIVIGGLLFLHTILGVEAPSLLILGMYAAPGTLVLMLWLRPNAGGLSTISDGLRALRPATPLLLTAVLQNLTIVLPLAIAARLLAWNDVVTMNAIVRLAVALSFFSLLHNAIVGKDLARAWTLPDKSEFFRTYRRSQGLLTLLIGGPAGLFLVVPELSGWLFGLQEHTYERALRIVMLGVVVTGVTGSAGTALIMAGEQRSLLKATLAGVIGGLTPYLIPSPGLTVVAASYGLTLALQSAISHFTLRQRISASR
jgi:O-antigen/teichoic acid export membrane protein